MGIKMVGLDYKRLSVEERELFSFTKEQAADLLKFIREKYQVKGCILIFTCNRTELYLSGYTGETSPYRMLCGGICDRAAAGTLQLFSGYEKRAVDREGQEAIAHLFQVACGMKSKIFGEDQIITQVKEALALARENKTTDVVLERLFQMAVTAAKKVKTEVHLTGIKTSVIENALEILKTHFPRIENLPCLVIGNGEIGRLAAARLLESGAKVTMTVRHYKTREVLIPVGCQIIDYRERYTFLNRVKVIFSATTSPHYTILWEDGLNDEGKQQLFADNTERVLFDLAMPRDISPEFGNSEAVTLYNIDSLGGVAVDAENNQSVNIALRILKEYEEEFETWYHFREYIPVIQEIGLVCAEDVYRRVEKPIKKLVKEEETRNSLECVIERAAQKVVGKLMYGMREHLDSGEWQNYMEAIQNVVLKDGKVFGE